MRYITSMGRHGHSKRKSRGHGSSWPSWLPPPASGGARVRRPVSALVVEDDPRDRELIASTLRSEGYTVETAGDGRAALRLLRSIRPEVIFLDLHMPVMNGAQFRQAQRRNPELLRIPTIVMTGDRSLEPLLDLAVEQTLRKPVQREALIAIVARHCGPQRS